MAVELADWPDKTQAAGMLGVSVKTLERMAQKGVIEQRMRPRPGASDMACFNPKDVQKAAGEKGIVISRPRVESSTEVQTLPPSETPVNFVGALEAMLERLVPKLLPPPAQEKPHLLTIREVEGLGYTQDWLRRQRKLGLLTRFGRKYSRFELERLAGKD
jgi:hypothetical protein